MHADDLIVDEGGDWQAVEALGEHLPELDVVPPFAFIVEAVDAVDGRTLVVAAQQEEVLGVLDLVGEQKADGLDVVLAAVDVVAEEKVVGVRRELAVLEETQEVVVLAVDVAFVRPSLPQIFRGASSSSKTGCDMKMSRDLRHNPMTSASVSTTDLPGLAPRTSSSRSMMESTSKAFSSPSCCMKIY